MMKVILILLIIAFQITIASSHPQKDSVLAKYFNDSITITAVVFLEFGSCIKCLIEPERVLLEAMRISGKTIAIVGMVNCNRAKEIHGYKEATGWKYYVEPDIKRATRARIGLKPTTDVCLTDSTGRIIAEINSHGDFQSNLKTLVQALEK